MANVVCIKVWCTKWALTQGVFEVYGKDLGEGMFQVPGGNGDLMNLTYYLHGEGKDWHRKEYDAYEYASKLADKKIESLKKQIKKIEIDQARNRRIRDEIRSRA